MKDYPTPLWRKHGGKIIRRQLKQAADALRAWRGKAARARLRGMRDALLTAPKILKKRRIIQTSRRVSLDYLESILTPLTGA